MDESVKDIFDAFQGKQKKEQENIKSLRVTLKNIDILKNLPEDLEELFCTDLELNELPNLPKNLKYLNCNNNKLKSLPELPNDLTHLFCGDNELEELPKLPKNLLVLNCSNNKLKSLPEIPLSLKNLQCNKNELEALPNLKNIGFLNASNNKITKIPKNNVKTLLLSDNLITKVSDYIKHSDINISLFNNPIAKEIYHIVQPDLSLIQYREYNGEKFNVITFRKGTVLFRNYALLSVVAEDFIGKVKKSFLWGEEYYLSPDHLVWYSLSPFDEMFGSIKSINVLQQDITLILGLLPSEDIGKNIIFYEETKYQIECNKKKYKRKVQQGDYACFKDDFMEQNPDIMGSFQMYPGDDRKRFNYKDKFILDYETFYEDHSKYINIPEVVLYPRKIRDKKDRVLSKKSFNQEWFEKHIDEYNVKPLHIFENLYGNLEKYKNIMTQFLSPEGFTMDGNTYHMTINKKTRDFVIAEFAEPSLLEICLHVSDKNKEKFLKK